MDVCDETKLCIEAKKLQSDVLTAGIPAIVSTGIWPGVSALMLAEAEDQLGSLESAHMSFFTAGTGTHYSK